MNGGPYVSSLISHTFLEVINCPKLLVMRRPEMVGRVHYGSFFPETRPPLELDLRGPRNRPLATRTKASLQRFGALEPVALLVGSYLEAAESNNGPV